MNLIDKSHAQVPSLNTFQANNIPFSYILEISENNWCFRAGGGRGYDKGRLTRNGLMYPIYNVYVHVS